MNKKLSNFFTAKRILIILSCICILFMGISLFSDALTKPLRQAVSYVVIPLQKGMNNLGLWISDKVETMQEISAVLEENEKLQSEVDELTEENNQLKQDSYELARLRELYELDEKYTGYEKVGARVIGTTTDNWASSFYIDKGSKDGIETDMNVIASGGLVGIISFVSEEYSLVKTITEDSSNVSGMIIGTNDTCIVSGDIDLIDTGFIHVSQFKSDASVRDGDKIVTSNISDKYLSGIVIGYVKDVTLDANNLTQSGYLVPAVDFDNLQEVLVITQKKQKIE